jgi:hypothetical protein
MPLVIAVAIAVLKLLYVQTGLDLVVGRHEVHRAIPFSVVALSLSIVIVCVWLMFEGVGYLRRRARMK